MADESYYDCKYNGYNSEELVDECIRLGNEVEDWKKACLTLQEKHKELRQRYTELKRGKTVQCKGCKRDMNRKYGSDVGDCVHCARAYSDLYEMDK